VINHYRLLLLLTEAEHFAVNSDDETVRARSQRAVEFCNNLMYVHGITRDDLEKHGNAGGVNR
jgi:hypothetical protein